MPIDPDEFERSALAQLDAVARFARSLAHDPPEAEDLVQETFLKAIRSRETYSPHAGGIRPWLFTILRNTWLTRLARRRLELAALRPEDLDALPAGGAAEAGTIDWSQCDERLVAAVRELPESLRTPLLLWALDGLTYQEIAQVAEVPIGTIMSRLHRARQTLIVRLQGLARDQRLGGE